MRIYTSPRLYVKDIEIYFLATLKENFETPPLTNSWIRACTFLYIYISRTSIRIELKEHFFTFISSTSIFYYYNFLHKYQVRVYFIQLQVQIHFLSYLLRGSSQNFEIIFVNGPILLKFSNNM